MPAIAQELGSPCGEPGRTGDRVGQFIGVRREAIIVEDEVGLFDTGEAEAAARLPMTGYDQDRARSLRQARCKATKISLHLLPGAIGVRHEKARAAAMRDIEAGLKGCA